MSGQLQATVTLERVQGVPVMSCTCMVYNDYGVPCAHQHCVVKSCGINIDLRATIDDMWRSHRFIRGCKDVKMMLPSADEVEAIVLFSGVCSLLSRSAASTVPSAKPGIKHACGLALSRVCIEIWNKFVCCVCVCARVRVRVRVWARAEQCGECEWRCSPSWAAQSPAASSLSLQTRLRCGTTGNP